MSMTDPIADLLARVRNAQGAKHESLDVPASKMKLEIVKILSEEGYIGEYESVEQQPQGLIKIHLRYLSGGGKPITGLERVSRPGRRVYRGKDEIPRVLNGLGISIVSTSKGVMTGSQCRKLGVGGEILCNVW